MSLLNLFTAIVATVWADSVRFNASLTVTTASQGWSLENNLAPTIA